MAKTRSRLAAADVQGPVMVSIGNEMKLNTFLDANPEIPRDILFGDTTEDFAAYNSAGFGKIGEVTPPTQFNAPQGLDFFKYMTTVAKVSPTDNVKFGEFPEGVLRLGGTFVIDGDKVTFGWSDAIPGDEPEIETVMKAAGA
mmetsp:Transcript_19141/g.51523  ORF Transcript_19141/g.51523 Transcript_19141/m.51523 type:complete len:142 (+) Transcript_19141:252-677(+)